MVTRHYFPTGLRAAEPHGVGKADTMARGGDLAPPALYNSVSGGSGSWSVHVRSCFVAVSIVALLSVPALAQQGNALAIAHGRAIATTWCSSCHLVSPDQTRANADVPTFASIAKRLPDDTDVLAAFVANPHPPMPNLNLSRQDIRDLLDYIATLK